MVCFMAAFGRCTSGTTKSDRTLVVNSDRTLVVKSDRTLVVETVPSYDSLFRKVLSFQ